MPSENKPVSLLVLPGDGIGPEIAEATVAVLEGVARILDLQFTFEHAQIGFASLKEQGTTFPDSVFEAAKAADGVILGPVSHNDYPTADKGGLNPCLLYTSPSPRDRG